MKAAAKEKEAKDKQAAAEAKEQVEKKAKHIQEKREHPFFQAVGDKLTDVKRLVVQGGLLKDTDFDEPFLIDASNETHFAVVQDSSDASGVVCLWKQIS